MTQLFSKKSYVNVEYFNYVPNFPHKSYCAICIIKRIGESIVSTFGAFILDLLIVINHKSKGQNSRTVHLNETNKNVQQVEIRKKLFNSSIIFKTKEIRKNVQYHFIFFSGEIYLNF